MMGTRANEKMSPSALLSSTWHFSRIENWWNSLIQMQTRMVAEKSRTLNRGCVEGTGTNGFREEEWGKIGKGNIHRKTQADLLFRHLVSYKTSSFIKNVFVFPDPLVSAEQCILFCIFTQTKREESRWLKLFLRLACSVSADEPSNYQYHFAENYFYLEMRFY